MKKILICVLVFAHTFTHVVFADTTATAPTTPVYTLKRGTSNVATGLSDPSQCWVKRDTDTESRKVGAKYSCNSASTSTSTYTAPIPIATLLPHVDVTKIPAPNIGWSVPLLGATGETVKIGNDTGDFRLSCWFSHMAFDDPLVYPGQQGKSHLHTFFGNTGANANSTSDSIANTGNSTCSGGTLNRTAYWFPTMIDTTDGTPIKPSGMLAYYKNGGVLDTTKIQVIPTGLRMIAGSSANAAEMPWHATGRFSCVGGVNGVGWQQSVPANCYQDNSMIFEVQFPQCWDGKNLDSPDHKSHMAYADGGSCPADHPVALPLISYTVYYDLSNVDLTHLKKWRLSSDNYSTAIPGGYSAHGDYMMGWDVSTMQKLIKNCVGARTDCHVALMGDGTKLLGDLSNGKQTP